MKPLQISLKLSQGILELQKNCKAIQNSRKLQNLESRGECHGVRNHKSTFWKKQRKCLGSQLRLLCSLSLHFPSQHCRDRAKPQSMDDVYGRPETSSRPGFDTIQRMRPFSEHGLAIPPIPPIPMYFVYFLSKSVYLRACLHTVNRTSTLEYVRRFLEKLSLFKNLRTSPLENFWGGHIFLAYSWVHTKASQVPGTSTASCRLEHQHERSLLLTGSYLLKIAKNKHN